MINRYWILLLISVPIWLLNTLMATVNYAAGNSIWILNVFMSLLLAAALIGGWQAQRSFEKAKRELEKLYLEPLERNGKL